MAAAMEQLGGRCTLTALSLSFCGLTAGTGARGEQRSRATIADAVGPSAGCGQAGSGRGVRAAAALRALLVQYLGLRMSSRARVQTAAPHPGLLCLLPKIHLSSSFGRSRTASQRLCAPLRQRPWLTCGPHPNRTLFFAHFFPFLISHTLPPVFPSPLL